MIPYEEPPFRGRRLFRPSDAEKRKKVCGALEAIRARRRRIALEKHLSLAYELLGIKGEEALWMMLEQLLEELLRQGPETCYAGQHPPQRSYDIRDAELWAYAWESSLVGRRIYLKFVLKRDYFLFIDCHESQ